MVASNTKPNGTPKILIVDDNQDLGSLLQMMLEDEGYEVRLAKDGSEGYLIYLLFGPDLVITDIQMPGKNGLQLMETIRIHNPTVGTIYMSGNLGEYSLPLEEERKRYQVGLLEKPFSKVELMKLLAEAAS
jgi:two-component system nitrogen regulation response regulator NtrX